MFKTRAILIAAAFCSLPAWANHHHHTDFDGESSPPPEICVEWRLDDGGITDAGPNEVETEDDGGTVTDILPCARKEPVGCSTTGGTMGALAVLVGLMRRRR